MTRRSFLVWQTLVVGLCCGANAVASGTPQVAMTERMRGAQRVVVASAVRVTPEWRTSANGDRLIVSKVALKVEETLKGAAASVMTLELEGGTLDGVTLQVSSLPALKAGDRAVFMLDETASGIHTLHLKGMGILKLDANNQVPGTAIRLDDLRRLVSGVAK
jgi:hypothetical protein